MIRFCRENPARARIVGLFGETSTTSNEMLGFALALAHGDHVEYAKAGTTRWARMGIPISYPLLWHLILWARDLGAAWFDLGGITAGPTDESPGAHEGISDFKRFFGGEEIDVGGEWTLSLRPFKVAIADTVTRAANAVRRMARSFSPPVRALPSDARLARG